MRIEPLTAGIKEKWDDLVANSDDAWFFHLYDFIKYNELLGYESFSFNVSSEKGELLGIFPLFYKKVCLKSIPVRQLTSGLGSSGFALSAGLEKNKKHEILTKMFSHVDTIAKQRKADEFIIRLPAQAPAYLPGGEQKINPLLFIDSFSPFRYANILDYVPLFGRFIDLTESEEALWNGLTVSCDLAIKQAKKYDLNMVQAQDLDDLKEYHSMHVKNFSYSNATPQPFDQLLYLWEKFHNSGLIKIFFAEKDTKRIAAIFIICYKNVGFYWAGCSLQEYNSFRPNNFLQWNVMKLLKERSFDWYFIGPHYPYLRHKGKRYEKMYNIGRFKQAFGGEDTYIHEGVKIYSRKKMIILDLIDQLEMDLRCIFDKVRHFRRDN